MEYLESAPGQYETFTDEELFLLQAAFEDKVVVARVSFALAGFAIEAAASSLNEQ